MGCKAEVAEADEILRHVLEEGELKRCNDCGDQTCRNHDTSANLQSNLTQPHSASTIRV
jgi:hypothetical protein